MNTLQTLPRDFFKNARAGLALAAGRPGTAASWRLDTAQVVMALALGWSAVALWQWHAAGPGAVYWDWGLAAEFARGYLWLLGVLLVAGCTGNLGQLPRLVLACAWANLWLTGVPAATILVADTFDIAPSPGALQWRDAGLYAWHALVAWRACDVAGAPAWWRRAGAATAYAGVLFIALTRLPDAPLFYAPGEPAAALDVESIYYRQEALLEGELAALAAQDPAAIDVYAVVMGAYSGEDVFRREVEQVRAIAEERLGLDGHVVTLVNHRDTVDERPLASRHNLARAIEGVGRVMDRDQDVLLVFITSHGHEDASVAVEFETLGLNDLYAGELRAMLDDAGILWRVVIVSSCYSGGFVEPLRSAATVVMTAAAADRASFGCGHAFDWTYFGRAYFAEALGETRDLVEAFSLARASIARREATEGKTPSLPQIHIGGRIAEHLRGWRPRGGDHSESRYSR